jgi:Ni/Co efflux regulator RcnB
VLDKPYGRARQIIQESGGTILLIGPKFHKIALILFVIVAWSIPAGTQAVPASDVDLTAFPNTTHLIEDNADWIAGCQRETGAICIYRDQKEIIPYFSHVAAIGLCYSEGHREDAKNWMTWYLSHLNSPDRFGLDATVYDYKVIDGQEISTEDYDSADSYSALFLSLCRVYYEQTGDSDVIISNKEKLVAIADVMLQMQQPDGLTWAKSDYKVKYLMDNSECYKGLVDMAYLCEQVYNDPELADIYLQAAGDVKNGTETFLWNPGKWSYCWEMDESGHRSTCHWNRWYPDAESQLWPVWCGMIDAQSPRADLLFKKLCRNHDWSHVTRRKQPAAIIGQTSAMMSKNKARIHIRTIAGSYLKHYPWPWNCAESGAFIMECAIVGKT